jgi:hypothetical protein
MHQYQPYKRSNTNYDLEWDKHLYREYICFNSALFNRFILLYYIKNQIEKSCPYPLEALYGNISVVVDKQVIYTCPNGVKYVGYCNIRGEWNITRPDCKPARCGYPRLVENSIIHLNGLEMGSTATYKCRKNFQPLYPESNHSVCLANSSWSLVNLKCVGNKTSLMF